MISTQKSPTLGSREAERYEEFSRTISNPRFVFMNHGYARPGLPGDDFAWLDREDRHHRYSYNLVRHLLDGIALDGKRVLDVGCGRGGTASYVARYTPAESVTGVDFSHSNIAFCKGTHPSDKVEFLQGDAQSLPLGNEAFDVVTNVESSHCYASLLRFFREVHRVLRPGGRFCYVDVMWGTIGPVKARILLKRAGFRVDHTADITEGVARALVLAAEDRRQLFTSMIDATHAGAERERVRELLTSLNENFETRVLRRYLERTTVYRLWRLRKC